MGLGNWARFIKNGEKEMTDEQNKTFLNMMNELSAYGKVSQLSISEIGITVVYQAPDNVPAIVSALKEMYVKMRNELEAGSPS